MLSCIHLFSIFILQSHRSTLKIAADLDYLSWIALLRDWGLVFFDKSAQRCRLNQATQVTANTSCYQANESLLTASSHVFAEVPDRPGLLHRQGAADHRADLREGPGGGDCGKMSQAVSPTCRLFSLAPSSGGKHRLFQLAALLQRARQNTTSGTDRGISWQMSFHFYSFTSCTTKMYSVSVSPKALNTKPCEGMDGFSSPFCLLPEISLAAECMRAHVITSQMCRKQDIKCAVQPLQTAAKERCSLGAVLKRCCHPSVKESTTPLFIDALKGCISFREAFLHVS